MTNNKDVWTITNMNKEAREIARAKAKAEGKTISSWLADLIKADHRETDISRLVDLIENRPETYKAHKQDVRRMFWWRK